MALTSTARTSRRQQAQAATPAEERVTLRVLQRFGLPLVVPVVVAAVWEYCGRHQLIADGLFPPMTKCVAALVNWITGWTWPLDGFTSSTVYSGTWLVHVGASVERVIVGFVIGSALAIAFGVLAGISLSCQRLVDPVVNAIRPISVTGWVPLALIVFGIGNRPAIFLTALATFFPVYVNAFSGARAVDANFIRAGRMLGATRRQVLARIILPAAFPHIVTGLRVASGIAWTTVVVAEILGAKSGVGYVLIDSYNQFRFDYVIAAMATLGACGYLTDRLIQWVFADALRWSRNS